MCRRRPGRHGNWRITPGGGTQPLHQRLPGAWVCAYFVRDSYSSSAKEIFMMFRKTMLAAAGLALGTLAVQAPAQADVGVRTGLLTCHVASGWGFVFGSTRDLNCTYTSVDGKKVGKYKGTISKFGVDIGYLQSGVLAWAVLAPSTDVNPNALAGDYGGLTAGATAGVGA